MAAMERRRKRELKELNTRAWNGENDVFPVSGSLDSNMKKNTAFIKRLRTGITPASVATFLQETKTLSLHKYLTEIVTACFEGLCKLKIAGDVSAGVEIVSALHQRFGPDEFTCFLGWLIGRGLSTPDKSQLKQLAQDVREREEKERIARQRTLLRVATELWLMGVLRSLDDVSKPEEASKARDNGRVPETSTKTKSNGTRSDGADPEPFPLEVLKDMLSQDREHVNLPLVVLFVKTFAWDVLGSRAGKNEGRKIVAEDGATRTVNGTLESATSTEDEDGTAKDSPLTSPDLQQRFKNILLRYFDDVKAHLIRDQRHLSSQSKRNAEAYVKSGEVFEDRQSNYEKQVKAQEKLVSSAQTLAEVLAVEMPDLAEKESNAAGLEGSIGLVKTGDYLRGQGEGAGIWEDEDERRFYESLTDLKDRVPGILLEDAKKKKADGDEQVGKKSDETESKDKDAKATDSEDTSTAIANKTVGAQVDALLARLVELTSRDQVDQFAIDFCFLNSKASRNRLVKAVEEIPKGRTDLLPLYARLIATLGRYLTDVPQAIISYLDDEFRSLQRRKSKEFLGQVRMVNIRYIAELTKFGVVPEHVIFHCLKVSLDEFSRMNIEIIGSLLENCGRYLLRNPETSPRMASFLETLQRKKAAQHLGQQERMLLENAMYYVNPPERAAIEQKERTPLDLYVRKLIYVDLNKKTYEKVTKQIRKLHWEEQEVVEILRRIFVKPGKIKFANIHLLAVILGALYRHHLGFTVTVIDEVLDRITVGLETNEFKYNQRRIAEVRYLGELYTYRLVDSTLIFDTLYKLLNYGHDNYAQPGKLSPMDLPDDYFRIRLVGALLETCGMYFEKGALKKKLDFFLSFFQYYINVKDPLPMDMEFVVQDTFSALRPNWKLVLNDLSEASRIFSVACKQNYQDIATSKTPEPEDVEAEGPDDDSDDVRVDGEERPMPNGEPAEAKSGEEDNLDATNEDGGISSSDEEEHIVVTRPEDQRDPEADAEFDRELAKLMAESVESRKFERRPQFDVALPMRRAVRDATSTSAAAADDSGEDSRSATPSVTPAPTTNGSGTMKFALLSKKGNRQHTRSIDLPSDSTFAVAMRSQQQAERAEQQRIKNLVLNYDLTDDQHDGEYNPSFRYVYDSASKRERLVGTGSLNKSLAGQQRRNYNIHGAHSGRSGNVDAGVKEGGTQHLTSTSPVDSHHHASPSSQPSLLPPSELTATHEGNLANEPGEGPNNHLDALHAGATGARQDKSGNSRSKQRARKLQLGDIDWYGDKSKPKTRDAAAPPERREASLDDFVKKSTGGASGPSRGRGRGGGSVRGRRIG